MRDFTRDNSIGLTREESGREEIRRREMVAQTVVNECRLSGKEALAHKIKELRMKADDLEMIYNALPEKPNAELDLALWRVFPLIP